MGLQTASLMGRAVAPLHPSKVAEAWAEHPAHERSWAGTRDSTCAGPHVSAGCGSWGQTAGQLLFLG